ncbi:CDP-glycerol glycerophosphotransferase family protein [Aciduliprofundum sp. MAR08-339]|uniref:CDP-glycerol glycerophosphotransferase family protein n=1 Tax=Aciduliprofundum sp. (strain MAR08-339) TaxID=673860 RepID=UPI00138A45C5
MSSKLFSDLEVVKSMLERESLFSYVFKILLISLQFISSKIAASSPISKKDKKIVIFTNLYYTGNPRAVYERMLEDSKLRKKYEIYWMAPQLSTFFELRKKKLPVLYKHGLLSVKKYMNADLWVLAHKGAWNVPFFLQSKYKSLPKLQLWHGVGPKGIHNTQEDYKIHKGWCVPSEFVKMRHIKIWNAPPNKLYVTGEAKIDHLLYLLNLPRSKLVSQIKTKVKVNPEYKFILYAPTYDVKVWPWGNVKKGIDEFCEILSEKNAYLLLRLHPYYKPSEELKKIIRKCRNIIDVSMSKCPDTMLVLAVSDILITDWSSIYTDFTVSQRPIIFLNVKPNYYTEQRGESLIPPHMRPGIIVNSKEELFDALRNIFDNKWSSDKKLEILQFIKLVHGKVDGEASRRVIEVIEKII